MHVLALCALLVSAAPIAQASSETTGDVRAALLDEISREPLALRGPRAVEDGDGVQLDSDQRKSSRILGLPVALHRLLISPQDGDPCTFTPSCSAYALEALRRHGMTGWVIASDRLLRCHGGNWGDYPHASGMKIDPVITARVAYETDASRAATGALLSLVPGLGQVTAGRWGDGLHAFTTVGILALGAAAYAHRDRPVPAALAGSAAAFFYVGNIYGGAVAHGRASTP